MHMLLLIGVSVGFALSVLTFNNFHAEKSFTSSVNHWECNVMKAERCEKQIARDSDPSWNRDWWYYEGKSESLSRESFWERVRNFFRRLF